MGTGADLGISIFFKNTRASPMCCNRSLRSFVNADVRSMRSEIGVSAGSKSQFGWASMTFAMMSVTVAPVNTGFAVKSS